MERDAPGAHQLAPYSLAAGSRNEARRPAPEPCTRGARWCPCTPFCGQYRARPTSCWLACAAEIPDGLLAACDEAVDSPPQSFRALPQWLTGSPAADVCQVSFTPALTPCITVESRQMASGT